MDGKRKCGGVMTGEEVPRNMKERGKAAKSRKESGSKQRTQAQACTPSTPRLPPVTPRRSQVRFQLVDTPSRTLRSVSRSVPRLNYYLPPLAELEADDSDLHSFASEFTASP